jgi:4-aminobutyrate aminotransferase
VGIELPEIFQWNIDPILPLAICRIGGGDITMQKYNLPGPKAKALIERDQAVISPSYARAYPFAMEHGKGTEVWDVDGNRFLDFAAGIAVTATGHCHPKVVQAIKDQADKFLHISADFYHQSWVELGERLDQIAPFKEDAISFMTNSGTESVEAAIKLARYHTGASQFIGFLGAFHGRTLGSLSFTASKPLYHEGFYPLMNGVVHVPYPNPYRPILATKPGEDYGETVVRYIEEQMLGKLLPAEDVAGILVESIQGEGGYLIPTPGFFPALRELCDRHDILLIVDEVQSGMGRTGKWWAIEQFGVEPDIVCVGKGIASGIPLGAIIARKSIVTWPLGSHGNTYGGNPVACAAALATMDLIRDEYLKNAENVGDYTIDALNEIAIRHPSIGQVRGIGLMIGVEFVLNQQSREPAHDFRERVVERSFERGLLTLGCGKSTIRISPPLSITRNEIDEGLEIFEEAIGLTEKEYSITHAA